MQLLNDGLVRAITVACPYMSVVFAWVASRSKFTVPVVHLYGHS